MISIEVLGTYTLACILIILAPGPDNTLAIGRGLSQGHLAACVSSAGAGLGLLVHILAATLGLAVLIKASTLAFSVIKIVGAVYLIWLGIKALHSRDLISFAPSTQQTYRSIFITGFLTNVLNPKPAIFIIAFVPQFVSPASGATESQVLLLGIWFALLTFLIFTILGCFASTLALWLRDRPRTVLGLNIGAGTTFIVAGLSVASLE